MRPSTKNTAVQGRTRTCECCGHRGRTQITYEQLSPSRFRLRGDCAKCHRFVAWVPSSAVAPSELAEAKRAHLLQSESQMEIFPTYTHPVQ